MEYKDEEEYIEYCALHRVVRNFYEKELAIILKFHPEWIRRLRRVVTKRSWNLITSCMFGDLKDSSDLYERFLSSLNEEKEKAKKDFISLEELNSINNMDFSDMDPGLLGNKQTLHLVTK